MGFVTRSHKIHLAIERHRSLNYYNLACAFAEDGDKAKLLANLSLAFQHKDNVLSGKQMPDPRADSSFQKYVRDPDFVKLMKGIGYK